MTDVEQKRKNWRGKAKEVAKNVVAPRATEIDIKSEFPAGCCGSFFPEWHLEPSHSQRNMVGEVRTLLLTALLWKRLLITVLPLPF